MPGPAGLTPDKIDWKTCARARCIGAALISDLCARHLRERDRDAAATALEQRSDEGMLDLRGVRVDRALLDDVLAAAPSQDGESLLPALRFDWAVFEASAAFHRAAFGGDAGFIGTTFGGAASFAESSFSASISFQGAKFVGPVEFASVRFRRGALFDRAEFEAELTVADSTFGGLPSFKRAEFSDVTIARTEFRRGATFERATFGGVLELERVRFRRDTTFARARFDEVRVDSFVALDELQLDGATAASSFLLRGAARTVTCRRTQFRERAAFELRRAEVLLERASFGAPSVVTTGEADLDDEELRDRCRAFDAGAGFERTERARVVSVQRSSVENLTLGHVDLRACRFYGAHNLSQLSIEAPDAFALSAPGRRWTRRRAIAEEHEWRRRHLRNPEGWFEGPVASPLGVAAVKPLVADDVAAIYRALRRGREEGKDEPGAADFYYGEMEMRRLGGRRATRRAAKGGALGKTPKGRAERAIVSAYWFVSGYGLRASRALLLLLVTLIVLTVALHAYGFQDRVRPFARPNEVQRSAELPFPPPADEIVDGLASGEAWAYSVGTATSVIGAPESQLTDHGRVFRIVLRVLGPLLIAFALLAIRGRVKR